MISTKELRRGNLVAVTVNVGYGETHRKETRFWTVASINQNHVQYKEFRCVGCKPKPCEGIELNEEWLVKLGFLDYGDSIYYTEFQNNGMRFYINMGNNCVRLSMDNNFYSSTQLPIRIFYVHQLQNLFFALTGTELTITER